MRRPFLTMLLLGAAVILAVDGALAFKVYVSNEKDNTVSVIDTDSLEVVNTFEVGQRPRGITMTKDGKQLLLC